MNKSERNAGARLERYAVIRYLRRQMTEFRREYGTEKAPRIDPNYVIKWLLSRDERTAKAKGGLGRGK